jgi:hypothetical protein
MGNEVFDIRPFSALRGSSGDSVAVGLANAARVGPTHRRGFGLRQT